MVEDRKKIQESFFCSRGVSFRILFRANSGLLSRDTTDRMITHDYIIIIQLFGVFYGRKE